jgi:hypothetical protein
MKDDHKNMLLGFLAAKSQQPREKTSEDERYAELNLFQRIWVAPFSLFLRLAWVTLLLLGIFGFFTYIDNPAAFLLIEPFWIFVEGREYVLSFLLYLSAWVIILLIKGRLIVHPRVLFWITFLPCFILFAIYMLAPLFWIT